MLLGGGKPTDIRCHKCRECGSRVRAKGTGKRKDWLSSEFKDEKSFHSTRTGRVGEETELYKGCPCKFDTVTPSHIPWHTIGS